MAASGDTIGFAEIREWALSRTRGTGVEIGCGDGRNFEYIPEGVALTAIEPDKGLAAAARERARGLDVTVVRGVAARIDMPTADVDFVVSTLTLCTVSSLESSLYEIHRVLKDGGLLVVVEHNVANSPSFAAWQRVADSLWPHLSGGCRTNRDIVSAITEAGFDAVEFDWFDFPSKRSLSPARTMFKGVFEKAAPEG
ncbi:class I SAM-dependent methyltransferase [Nocardiopsis kunsanensis]|uniref:Methyltransferase type 11 domain-containing protein n=1 Tax=Nocardiopsis kunsanensis TaxID=141693 RepID=A0A918XDV3_9ACTN|nr:class I SAM-dependent methyltransferase [Nocardiopsis kunsanensis]GHD26440.1 hypothetical protein GCM10007147_24400 [Nocardiopsis kunsanensis]